MASEDWESGDEKVFYQTLATAQKLGMLRKSHLNKVNVNTTMQEKAIAYHADARLNYKMNSPRPKCRGITLPRLCSAIQGEDSK